MVSKYHLTVEIGILEATTYRVEFTKLDEINHMILNQFAILD